MSPAEIRIVQALEAAKETGAITVAVTAADLQTLYQAAELGLAIQEAERILPGWGWLVRENRRSGEAGGFFANLTSPDFRQIMSADGFHRMEGRICPTYGDTAAMAVRGALATATAGTRQ